MKPITIVVLKNLITIAIFAVLAVVFGKWWIVLFAVLFMTEYKTSGNEETKEEE